MTKKQQSEVIMSLILILGDTSPEHKKIFLAMNEVWSEGDPVDLVTLFNKLKENGHIDEIGGAEYLASIFDCGPAQGILRGILKAAKNETAEAEK